MNLMRKEVTIFESKSGIKVHALKLKEFPIFSWVVDAA